MSLVITQSDYFWADLRREVDGYRDCASPDLARRYADAVEATSRNAFSMALATSLAVSLGPHSCNLPCEMLCG